jgi:hypothetical protein
VGRRARDTRRIAALAGALGLLAVVIGTFLPWLHSGRASLNSYQAGGAVRRLIATSGVLDHLLALWPLLGSCCAVAVALFLVGLRTPAVMMAGGCALGAGSASVGALATGSSSYARAAATGPILTLIGATLVALAVLSYALAPAAVARSPDD